MAFETFNLLVYESNKSYIRPKNTPGRPPADPWRPSRIRRRLRQTDLSRRGADLRRLVRTSLAVLAMALAVARFVYEREPSVEAFAISLLLFLPAPVVPASALVVPG